MLEPLSALSVACAAVQFVDFSVKVVSKGVQLFDKGSLSNNDELELTTNELNRLMGNLTANTPTQAQIWIGTRRPISPEEEALIRVAASCKEVGEKLLELLGRLKTQNHESRMGQGVDSFRVALRDIRKRGDVQDTKKRLHDLQAQLSIHLLSLLSDKQSRVLRELDGILRENQRSETTTHNKIDKLRREIVQELRRQHDDLSTNNSFGEIGTKCYRLAEEGQRVSVTQKFLRSLSFRSIKTRQASIKVAHSKTFEWMLDDLNNGDHRQPQFLSWLRHQNGIFWVSGKAGSGKSTLMKFLADHRTTRTALQHWANPQQLVTASFFFWSAGNSMQKSQQGLLQSFLCQILGQCPELVGNLRQSCWSEVNLDDDQAPYIWTNRELIDGLAEVAKQDLLPVKFCFFIDGLDEYEGEESDIISVLRELSKSTNVKICASSRPWNPFKKAFGNNPHRRLFMHDFTKDDIRLFATDTLSADSNFVRLASQDTQYLKLIEDITERAQGVFLWVYLAVRSLIRGSVDDNSIFQMQKRLDTFPSDLEGYFRQMLDSVEEIYHERAAQTLQLVLQAKPELTATEYWFFEQEADNPKVPCQKKALSHMAEETRSHVNAYCRDLLEFASHQTGTGPSGWLYWGYDIVFLHRTVKDFLETTEIQDLLQTRAGTNFDALTTLCKVQLALITSPALIPHQHVSIQGGSDDPATEIIFKMFQYAQEIEVTRSYSLDALLDEFESRIIKYFRMRKSEGFWSEALDGYNDAETFVSAATKAGLCLYVGRRLDQSAELLQPSLLRVTYHPNAARKSYLSTVRHSSQKVNLKMMEELFTRGVDPNQQVDDYGMTLWREFIRLQAWTGRLSSNEHIARAAEVFIAFGADSETDLGPLQAKLATDQFVRIQELIASKKLYSASTSEQAKPPRIAIKRRGDKSAGCGCVVL